MNYRFDPDTDDEYDAWKDGEILWNGMSYEDYRETPEERMDREQEERLYGW